MNHSPYTRGIASLAQGYELVKKENKTEQEQKAADSFQRMVQATAAAAIILLALFFMILFFAVPKSEGTVRTGIRVGDQIEYTYETSQSIPYNPSVFEMEEGSSAALFLDENGKVFKIESLQDYRKESDRQSLILIILILVLAAGIIGTVSVIKAKTGKDFEEYRRTLRKSHSEKG